MGDNNEFYTIRGYQILNSENKVITPSMEDYLEMVYRTYLEDGYARINQLAKNLNVRPSSASKVIQKLNTLGLVDFERYGIILLTDKGKDLGSFLLRRHEIIEELLKNLGVSKTLLKDTEMIEHYVSINALKSFYIFNKFLSSNPRILTIYNRFKENFQDENIDLFYPGV